VSGRDGEPDVAGTGQEAATQHDFAWMTPSSAEQVNGDTEDFGPRPLTPGLEEDARTQSAPHPEPGIPMYTEPNASGPLLRPYIEQVPSGPHRQGPYVDSVPSGPQPQQFTEPAPSGPHQYAEAVQSYPEHSGAQAYPEQAGPQQPYEQPSFPATGYAHYAQPQQQHPQPVHPRQRTHADELSSAKLIKQTKRRPQSGWRKAVFLASGHLINVGESPADVQRRELITRVNQPLRGCYKIAMLSLKGGVGKTTTTVGLGATLASLRGDRVIAVDANPDRGTLSDKVRLETAATVRDLLNERGQIERYADVRAFTSQATSRLEVLASDRDPTVSVAFSENDYCEVAQVLEHYYSICITDCGTGLLHSAMAGVLKLADQIVLVSSPSVDGARSASATLDWLAAHAYGDLVRNAVVVLSIIRPGSRSTVDLERLEQHFAARCRAVTRIPFDSHLEEGAELELDQLSRATADAYLALAALVGDGLAASRRAGMSPGPA
jgi:MinD-like ATPase involved in chromosome partitioning or flagellar assembly